MFALWYLSFAIDEIRKRLGYPSLFGRQTNDIVAKAEPMKPDVKPEIKPEPVKAKEPEKKPEKKAEAPKVEPERKPEPPKIAPKVPEVPKSNTAKQPESPETQELMKTYEIPDKEDTKKKPEPTNGGSARQASPGNAKPKEVSSRTPTPQASKSPSPVKNGNLAGKTKSPKDATSAFLAEESSTKSRAEATTKRYPKTVKRP